MQSTKQLELVLAPTEQQCTDICKFCGYSRYVYNELLARTNRLYDEYLAKAEILKDAPAKVRNSLKKPVVTAVSFHNQLPEIKVEHPWLEEVTSQSLKIALSDLSRSYTAFLKEQGAKPVFRKKGRNDAMFVSSGFKVDRENDRIHLPKIGWLDADLKLLPQDCKVRHLEIYRVSRKHPWIMRIDFE